MMTRDNLLKALLKRLDQAENTEDDLGILNKEQHLIMLQYAIDLVETMDEEWVPILEILEEDLLNGAKGWCQYSRDGNSLIYNSDIAERLGVSSDINGVTLLDLQARALGKAYEYIKKVLKWELRKRTLANA